MSYDESSGLEVPENLDRASLLKRMALGGAALSIPSLAAAGTALGSPAAVAELAANVWPKHPKWKFAGICHVTTNPFFVPTQYGAADAAKMLDVTYTWGGSTKADVGEMINAFNPFRMLNNGQMRRRARQHIEDIGIRTLRSVQSEVAMLSGGQRQAIAIARSVHSGARILLLDEPLAAMGAKEGEMILDLIRDLKAEGHSMIVVAHNYVHVLEVCDRVNLLQHGRITLDKLSAETSVTELTDLVAAEYRQQRQRDTGA